MLKTYKAVLRGDHIEWVDRPPHAGKPVPVHVTLLDEADAEPSASRGHDMARALGLLAESGGLAGISDAGSWQREIRRDRTLPERRD